MASERLLRLVDLADLDLDLEQKLMAILGGGVVAIPQWSQRRYAKRKPGNPVLGVQCPHLSFFFSNSQVEPDNTTS